MKTPAGRARKIAEPVVMLAGEDATVPQRPRRGPPGCTFATVEAIGRTLPDVDVTTAGGLALKVRGWMFACVASHKSAEPNSLMVRMDVAARDALIEDDPGTYYLKEHYVSYPSVLVRLGRVRADALRDLLAGAHRFVSAKRAGTSGAGSRRAARSSRERR